MKYSRFIPEIPYESSIRKVFGSQWRTSDQSNLDGAFGLSIAKCVANGDVPVDLKSVSNFFGMETDCLVNSFNNLFFNGCLQPHRIKADKRLLNDDDLLTCCYYAGYASGDIGSFSRNEEVFCQ